LKIGKKKKEVENEKKKKLVYLIKHLINAKKNSYKLVLHIGCTKACIYMLMRGISFLKGNNPMYSH